MACGANGSGDVVHLDDRPTALALLLGLVGAFLLEGSQIVAGDVAGDIFAGEHRSVETLYARIATAHRIDEVRQILEYELVGADELRYLVGALVMCDELLGGGHVDAVH